MRTNVIKKITFPLILALSFLVQGVGAQLSPTPIADMEIRGILEERIDRFRQSVGIVVGVIAPAGRTVVSHGRMDTANNRPVNGDTVFEIGSITKVFTALLLTDMVERGEVKLTDPVAKYLPSEVRTPARNGEQILLKDLAAHTSALPPMPTNVISAEPANPFADYSVRRLYDFLSSYELPRDIGSRFEYSNIGSALLGHALARRTGMDYGDLIETRITQPLGMRSTRIPLTADMKQRLATGHAYGLAPTPNWDLGALVAAGALRSTTNDLLTFLDAHLGYTRTPLAPAMAAMLKSRRQIGQEEIGLAWFVRKHDGAEIVFHEGNTGGYRSFIGYESKSRKGVVVLSNAGTGAGVSDIGMHVLDPTIPLLAPDALEPPKERRAISVDLNLLDRYVGRYRFPSSQLASITRQGDHLVLQGDGYEKIAFYPESTREFFAMITDAQITFETDPQGRVIEVMFYNGGSPQRLRRAE